MKIEVVMPKMGESLQEGTITKWLKKVGDVVERDEMILEISTDKVDTEVPSPTSGVIISILANESETVEVGKAIAIIETEESSAKIEQPIPEKAPEVKEAIPVPVVEKPLEIQKIETSAQVLNPSDLVDVVMPKMGESLQEGTITKWLKKVGDKIERDEMILEISTDKVDTEVPSPVGGILSEILASEGQTIEVGNAIARISTGAVNLKSSNEVVAAKIADTSKEIAPVVITNEIPVTTDSSSEAITGNIKGRFYSPLVRSIAKAEGVTAEELERIKGNGAEGRVTKQDILDYIQNRKQAVSILKPAAAELAKPIQQPAAKPVSIVMPPTVIGDDDEIIPMDRVRQLIAEHMTFSKQTSAHVTSVAEADVTKIVNFRNKIKDQFSKREGFNLTFTPFFSKAIIDAVKQFPMVNVSVDGKNIIRHKRINLSFATALADGNLIVPVIKNADILNISGLSRSVYDLSLRARTKKLNPDDIQGGTITLTNVGTFGTLFGTPVINQPQTAIVGVGSIQKRPVVREYNNENIIVIRDMVYVSITYDHRVIDGMLAGQCLAAIVKSLESMSEENITL